MQEPHSINKLTLIRHAHRDTGQGRDRDNGLSSKGLEQARGLIPVFEPLLSQHKFEIRSSPKIRCQQTLKPLCEKLGCELIVDDLLDEQKEQESTQCYYNRIADFIERLNPNPKLFVLACSHGDWIPDCIEALTGQVFSIKKGRWVSLSPSESWKERLQLLR